MADSTGTAANSTPFTLREQLLDECSAMAKYALSSGIEVPGNLLQPLEDAQSPTSESDSIQGSTGTGVNAALENGSADDNLTVRRLAKIHARLAALVAPATPRSVQATQASQGTLWRAMGSVRLLRQLMVAAGVSLAIYIISGASPDVTGDSGSMDTSSGWTVVVNQIHFLSAAALGASFFSLFKANRFVTQSTFDPRFESTYWVRLGIGVIAGAILANFIDVDISDAASHQFEKATVAMLGGFSADVVQRILNRMVETLESLVQGGGRDLVASREQAMKVQLTEQLAQRRMDMAANLVTLQQQIGKGLDSDKLGQKLEQMIGDLIEREGDSGDSKAGGATTTR